MSDIEKTPRRFIERAADTVIREYYEQLSLLSGNLWSQQFYGSDEDPRGALAGKWAAIFDLNEEYMPDVVYQHLVRGYIEISSDELKSIRNLRTIDVFDSIRVVHGFMPKIKALAAEYFRKSRNVGDSRHD